MHPRSLRLAVAGAVLVLIHLGQTACCERRVSPRADAVSPPSRRAATSPGPLGTLEAAFARARTPVEALAIGEAIKCRRLRSALLAVGATPHHLPAVDRVQLPPLRRDEALLSFVSEPTTGRLHRFVARGRGPRVSPRVALLPPLPAAGLTPLLIKTRDELELGELEPAALDRLWRLLRRAHQQLLGDLGSALAGVSHLVVSADGLVRHLPLHVLLAADPPRAPSRAWRFVGSERSVSYLPCVALAHRPRRLRPRTLRLFVPGYGRLARPLDGAADEARALARLFAGSEIVLGQRATARSMIAALRAGPPAGTPDRAGSVALHFAGHGLASLDDPHPAATVPELILAGGEPLTAARATRAELRATLVSLASCTTAYVARFRDGHQRLAPTNLVEALLAAGVQTVIAASWAVKDVESSRQMRSLYEQLARGAQPAAALAAAYRARAGRIAPPHPRFWGAYAVHGSWRWRAQ